MSDFGREYWTPPLLFSGDTVFLLGGGPTLTKADVARLDDQVTVAINSSCLIAPMADILYFTDTNWFEDHRRIIEAWPGTVVTQSRVAKATLPDRMHRIRTKVKDDFTRGEEELKFGRSSGHSAISLAIALGAARVVLLGYDMRIVDRRSHHHDEYPHEDAKLFTHDFLLAFEGWNAAAERIGVQVLNATPGSALKEFPMTTLDEVLASI